MQNLDELSSEILSAVEAADTTDALEAVRIDALGKQGRISLMMRELGGMDPEERKAAGQTLNKVKDGIAAAIETRQAALSSALLDARQLQHLIGDGMPAELAAFGQPDQWHLVVDVDSGRARVYRALDATAKGDFVLRVASQFECGVGELLSLVVELDLMPTWNRFCASGTIFHRVSCVDLYAGGAARMPWPVPRYSLMLRARLLDLMASSLGCMLVVAHTPPGGDFLREEPPHGGRQSSESTRDERPRAAGRRNENPLRHVPQWPTAAPPAHRPCSWRLRAPPA